MSAIGFEHHDHATCIASTLQLAEDDSAVRGLKFTALRRRSLEILLREHRAMGAYDLLAVLADDGHSAQPPVTYRALDFLVTAGFAHKIERLNAYIAYCHLGSDHTPAFFDLSKLPCSWRSQCQPSRNSIRCSGTSGWLCN